MKMKKNNKSNKVTNNIKEESRASLMEFRKKQISTNIKYHKVFLILLFLINFLLIFFIFVYKRKANEIKILSSNHKLNINTEDNNIETLRSSLNHKLLNICIINKSGAMRFSFIFENSEEFNTLKNLVYEYKTKFIDTKLVPVKTFLLYQSAIDDYTTFLNRISYFDDILIMIQTNNGNKFGIYVKDTIIPNEDDEFESISSNIFIYSFETQKIYEYYGNNKISFSVKKDKLIVLGDDELVINNNYYSDGGYINFPLKSFHLYNANKNIFTGENKKFYVKNLEVFSFL
jgi:uncharacterized protein YfaA (DUF2138 family)